MRLVHLSDLHLGFRQFDRTTSIGVNRREADVESTFARAVDRIIEIAPDLIIIGGDVFHVVRPSNHAVVTAFQEFERLVRALPNHRIVMVAGNHDTPRATETGGILSLFSSLGIHVVDKGAARLEFADIGLSVLAVPDIPGLVRPRLVPDPAFRYNVMVMHGEVQGMLDHVALPDRAAVEISTEELHTTEWNYIGLGHWHVYRELAPNLFYSGSIDYTSSNPWGELVEQTKREVPGKGFVERNLATGEQTFHVLPASREYVDLPRFSAIGLTSTEIDQRVRDAVDACPGGIEDKIVRLVVTDVGRDIARGTDTKAVREYRRRAFNFQLEFRRPALRIEIARANGALRGSTLEQRLAAFISEQTYPSDVVPAELLARAESFLQQTIDPSADPFALAKSLEASVADHQLAEVA